VGMRKTRGKIVTMVGHGNRIQASRTKANAQLISLRQLAALPTRRVFRLFNCLDLFLNIGILQDIMPI